MTARSTVARPVSMTADHGSAARDAARSQDYRADIDGLRAVAIALVVAFHYGVPGFSGGYLGVDLFFVVSGFLIASIFERIETLSAAALLAFYGRRVKRLMPAFVVVAAATIVAATFLMLPEDYDDLLKSVRDSFAFVANVFFERETTGYFAADAAELPWLHTWSLSIEWQFYLAFPLVVAALRRLPAGRARSGAWVALVAASTALSIAMVADDPARAYFSGFARFFEFGLGAVATLVPRLASSRMTRWLPWVGIAALIALARTFDATTPFPGLAAVPVCVVGFALIVGGAPRSPLAHPALAWLGRRSYGIYLWHWPIVALANYVQWRPSAFETALAIVAVVALADATHRFVEKPGLRATWRPTTAIVAGCALPFVCVAALTLVLRHLDDLPQRLGAESEHAHANLARFASRAADRCHDDRDADIEPCAFGDLHGVTQALLIGDSHARHFRPFVGVLAERAHVKVYGLTDSECPALEGSADRAPERYRRGCVEGTARDFALIRSGRFRQVIFAERWIGYPREALDGLDRSIAVAIAAGATPIVFAPVAEDGTNTRNCFYRHIKLRRPFVETCSIARDNPFGAGRKAAVASLFADLRRKYPSLIVIDPQAVQCRAGSCETVIDDTPIYADTHHLNAFGSTMLAQAYVERYGDPLLPR